MFAATLIAFVVSAGAPAYGPVQVTPNNVRFTPPLQRRAWLVCNGTTVYVVFRASPGQGATFYAAVSTDGQWRVRRIGLSPTSSAGRIWAVADRGKVFAFMYEGLSHKQCRVVELRGTTATTVASLPDALYGGHGLPDTTYIKGIGCSSGAVWLADFRWVMRVRPGQVQSCDLSYHLPDSRSRMLPCQKIADIVVVGGRPIICGERGDIVRLKGEPSKWQDPKQWEKKLAPRLQCPYMGTPEEIVLERNGRRVWALCSDNELKVATAPIGPQGVGAWRVMQRPVPNGAVTTTLARTPSGPPKLVLWQRAKARDGSDVIQFWYYDLTPTAIGQRHLICRFRPGGSKPANMGGYLSAAVDSRGYVYVLFDWNHRLWVVSNNPNWTKSGTTLLSGGPTNTNVGHGVPELVPTACWGPGSWGATAKHRREWAPGGGFDAEALVLNRGASFAKPLTILYQFAGIKLYVTYPANTPTIGSGQEISFYPGLRVKLRSRRDGEPLKPSFTYRDPKTGKTVTTNEPPVLRVTPQQLDRRPFEVTALLPLQKYKLRVVIDPDKRIRELNEKNNVYEREIVVCGGLHWVRRGNKQVSYSNDLSLYRLRVWQNEPLRLPGFVRAKAAANVWVLNLYKADWFKRIVLRASIDNKKVWQGVVGPLSRDATIPENAIFPGRSNEKKISAVLAAIPLDFTNLSLGQHVLKIELDPDNKLGDNNRSDNVARMKFLVRKRGATLKVHTVDYVTGDAIKDAIVRFFRREPRTGRKRFYCGGHTDDNGTLIFYDMPTGSYPAGTVAAFKPLRRDQPLGTQLYAYTKAGPFTLTSGQTREITIRMERAVDLSGRLLEQGTNQLAEGGAVVHLDDDRTCNAWNSKYKFGLVAPGRHTFKIRGFRYYPLTTTLDVHGDAEGKMTHDFKLRRLPHGNLVVKTKDTKGHKLTGTSVTIACARGTSNQDGSEWTFSLPAGRKYTVIASKKGYGVTIVKSPKVIANQTVTVTVKLPKISSGRKRLKCRVVTLAQLESFPEMSIGSASSPEWSVKAEYGAFKMDLVLHYHKLRSNYYVDDLFIGLYPEAFYKVQVSSKWDPTDLIGGLIGKVSKTAGDVWEKAMTFLQWADIPNSLYDLITGEQLDFSKIQEGTLYGSHISMTGAEEESGTLYWVPDLSIPITASTEQDKTVVLVRRVTVTDGDKLNMTKRPWWHSPGMMYWHLGGKKANWKNLKIVLNVDVLNSNFDPSVLGARSRNNITWIPSKKNGAHMEPEEPVGVLGY